MSMTVCETSHADGGSTELSDCVRLPRVSIVRKMAWLAVPLTFFGLAYAQAQTGIGSNLISQGADPWLAYGWPGAFAFLGVLAFTGWVYWLRLRQKSAPAKDVQESFLKALTNNDVRLTSQMERIEGRLADLLRRLDEAHHSRDQMWADIRKLSIEVGELRGRIVK